MPLARASSRPADPLLPARTRWRYGEIPSTWEKSPPGGMMGSPSESHSGHRRFRRPCPCTPPGAGPRLGGVLGAGSALAAGPGAACCLGRGPGLRRGRCLRMRGVHSWPGSCGPGIQVAPPLAALGKPSSPHRGPRSHSLGEAVLHRLHRHMPDCGSQATSWPSAPAGPPTALWHLANQRPCSLDLVLGHRSNLHSPSKRLWSPWTVCRTHPHLVQDTSSAVTTKLAPWRLSLRAFAVT